MVKIEEYSDSGSSSDLEIVDQRTTQVSSSASKSRCAQDTIDEQSFPSSSSSQLKSYFLGMGFAPALVDKVFQENGEADTESLLESLIKLSSSSAEESNCLDGFSSFVKEEADFEWDDDFDTKDSRLPSFQDGDKRSYLLMMNFSEEEVDLAINQLGMAYFSHTNAFCYLPFQILKYCIFMCLNSYYLVLDIFIFLSIHIQFFVLSCLLDAFLMSCWLLLVKTEMYDAKLDENCKHIYI